MTPLPDTVHLLGLVLVPVLVAGCNVGNRAEDQSGADDPRRDDLGIRCDARLSLEGRVVDAAPEPEDVHGCWPVGTWIFAAAVESSDCAPGAFSLETQYAVRVTRDPGSGAESYEYLNDPSSETTRLSVSSGGSGLCTGSFTLFSPDRKTVFNLKPMLQADGRLDGAGEIELYETSQW